MKYIKINTPLQVVSGFATAEAIVVIKKLGKSEVVTNVYKSFDAYNQNEKPIKLKNELPICGNYYINPSNDDLINTLLSILLHNEYDAEIVDTDAPVNKQGTVKTIKVEVDSQKIKKIINDVIDCLGESPEHKIELLQKLAMYKRPVDFKEQLKQAQDDAQELAVEKDVTPVEKVYLYKVLNSIKDDISSLRCRLDDVQFYFKKSVVINQILKDINSKIEQISDKYNLFGHYIKSQN